MKQVVTVLFLLIAWADIFAQKQNFDLATYDLIQGWKKQATNQTIQFSKENTARGAYCVITLYKSIDASDNPKNNFDQSWEGLVKQTLGVDASPEMQPAATENGWEVQSGYAPFEKDGNKGIALLVTSTGFTKAVNILILTNTDEYEAAISKFLESVSLKKPVGKSINAVKPVEQGTVRPEATVSGKFKFNITNFDDGWTSTIKEDWVEVTKGDIKVLLHYPNEKVKPANTDVNVMCEAAWNVLVAPRYSNIENYQLTPGVLDYQRPYYAQAGLTDKATGKKVFVALFKKGNTCWIEFITPDKNSFIQHFGLDVNTVNYYSDSEIWSKLVAMNNYNKFAIAATDFSGKWSDHFASNTFYTNVYTGLSAGMSTYSSSQYFEFSSGQKYKWQLVAANSYGGSSSFAHAKGAGTFKVINDWQINFSDIEGKPKTYDAYFSAIKGSRILWMNDAKYPGSGIFTGFGKE